MSTARECQQRRNRHRETCLLRAQRERIVNRERAAHGPSTDDLEHDAQREYDLIDGTQAEQEAEQEEKW